MSAEKAYNTIEELARYEEEGWNDPIFLEEGSLNYKNANIEQLLGVMECQVDTLMNDAISLMGKENSSPQSSPQVLPSFETSFLVLGRRRGVTDPPIKPHSPDSFRMKVVGKSTINTPPLPHMASFHPNDTYCYYHPCIDDPKKHYGFKPGLLGHNGSLGVDFSNMEMIENDWELESKEVSFFRKRT
ncbi:hypothetical protein Tco_0353657 [Tanacetum coccineum]